MHSESQSAGATGHRLLSKTAALGATAIVVVGSVVLLAFNLLVSALTCGDDGALDYGTAGAATRRYCRVSFEEHLDRTAHLGVLPMIAIVVLGVVGIAVAALVTTRRRGWLHASLAVLGAVVVWTLTVLVVAAGA